MKDLQNIMLDHISTLVEIPSVYEDSEKYPFGEPIDRVLTVALNKMKDLEFTNHISPSRRYGYSEMGEGELFAVLGHLDVVSAREEDGWNTPPFTPTLIDGALYGRGTQDDKGPMVAAIYAFTSLLEEGYSLSKRVRFIFGLDEENLWQCMKAYEEEGEETPSMGFTPDSGFPLIYAEKGLLQVKITSSTPFPTTVSGGDSFNAVSSHATVSSFPALISALKDLGYDYTTQGNSLTVTGVSAHSKNPWKGVNANLRLLDALSKSGMEHPALTFALAHLKDKFKFEGFTEKSLEDFSGPLTINVGKIQGDASGFTFSVDLRLPTGVTKEETLGYLSATAQKFGLTIEEYDWLRPIHVPKESELVQKLMAAYTKVTKDTESQPMISAGATYARAFDNCVAFGPNFPGHAATEHQPNEHIVMDDLMKCYDIYKEAFRTLVFHKK